MHVIKIVMYWYMYRWLLERFDDYCTNPERNRRKNVSAEDVVGLASVFVIVAGAAAVAVCIALVEFIWQKFHPPKSVRL